MDNLGFAPSGGVVDVSEPSAMEGETIKEDRGESVSFQEVVVVVGVVRAGLCYGALRRG